MFFKKRIHFYEISIEYLHSFELKAKKDCSFLQELQACKSQLDQLMKKLDDKCEWKKFAFEIRHCQMVSRRNSFARISFNLVCLKKVVSQCFSLKEPILKFEISRIFHVGGTTIVKNQRPTWKFFDHSSNDKHKSSKIDSGQLSKNNNQFSSSNSVHLSNITNKNQTSSSVHVRS